MEGSDVLRVVTAVDFAPLVTHVLHGIPLLSRRGSTASRSELVVEGTRTIFIVRTRGSGL